MKVFKIVLILSLLVMGTIEKKKSKYKKMKEKFDVESANWTYTGMV